MIKLKLVFAAAVALGACATADTAPVAQSPPSAQPTHPTTPERNPAVQVDATVFIPPPPQANSAAEMAERSIVRGPWTAERRQQALEDNAIDPFAAFDSVLGADFTAANFPATTAALDRAGRAAGFAGDPVKFLHRRQRPFLSDDAITPCIPGDERLRASFSYPSGHAALGWAWALVLAELVPSRADAIIERGRDFTWSRVVCGVHYPSDVQAGRDVGAAAIARLHADPEFQRQLEAARAELAAAYGD
ncbi:MAG TPA: phosphatase PAP2 family protein [Vitreimonas sp.]|uniref:acid phosphatase n=1 Tax=Vitreimonas sp. TaxID=3069702 RepID=UPI002D3FF320|nr:phosphatase PAP2 family protein [Vitreimonas sp.]HYD87605.1 phosphatase PAP2 family protein [Vitreimonas sp.]